MTAAKTPAKMPAAPEEPLRLPPRTLVLAALEALVREAGVPDEDVIPTVRQTVSALGEWARGSAMLPHQVALALLSLTAEGDGL